DIPRAQRVQTEEEYESITIPGHQLQAFASQDYLKLPIAVHLPPNQYVLLRSAENPSHGVPARHLKNGEFRKLRRDHITIRGGRTLNALNLGQHFFLDALYDP